MPWTVLDFSCCAFLERRVRIGRVQLNIMFVFSAVVLSLISYDCVENCATIKSDVIEIQHQYINIYTYLICNSQHFFSNTSGWLRTCDAWRYLCCVCVYVRALCPCWRVSWGYHNPKLHCFLHQTVKRCRWKRQGTYVWKPMSPLVGTWMILPLRSKRCLRQQKKLYWSNTEEKETIQIGKLANPWSIHPVLSKLMFPSQKR